MKPNARDAVVLVALTALGAALRLPYLAAGLWRDEASTYFETLPRQAGGVVAAVVRGELNPPGYFLFEWVWTFVAGTSAVALKFPSFLFGVALIGAVYALGRIGWSRVVALLAAGFAAVAPVALDLSGEARPYALAALLAALALCCYLRATHSPRPLPALVGFVAAGAMLAYVHYTGVVMLLLLALATPYVLWRAGRLGRWVEHAGAFVAVGVLYAPWLPFLWLHLRTGTPWTEPVPRGQMLGAAEANLTSLLPLLSAHGSIWIALVVGLVVVAAIVIVRMARGAPAAWPSGPTLAVALCALGGAAVGAILSQREPRYMYVYAPAAWVWFGALLAGLTECILGLRRVPLRVTLGTTVALALGLLAGGEVRARLRAPHTLISSGIWSLTPEALGVAAAGRVVFLVVPDYLGPTMTYYVGVPAKATINGFARWDDPAAFTPQGYFALWDSPTVLGDVEERIRAAGRVRGTTLFLVRDHEIAERGKMEYTRADGLLAWLRATYPKIQSHYFPGRKESVDLDVYALTTR